MAVQSLAPHDFQSPVHQERSMNESSKEPAAMDRYLVISSDCHAGLQPQRYRDYLAPKYRDAFDAALPLQIAQIEASE